MFPVKLTDFRVIDDPEWSLAPMGPFRVKIDPGDFFFFKDYTTFKGKQNQKKETFIKLFCYFYYKALIIEISQ